MIMKEISSNFGESSSLHQILNETQISHITRGSAEKDFKDIDSLINKVLKEDKTNTSLSSCSRIADKSNSLISNLEIWNGNLSRDDSKVFYESYTNINNRKKYGLSWKKKPPNRKTLQINTDTFKTKNETAEDYNEDVDEHIQPMKQKHLEMIQTYEYNKNNLSQISQMEPGKFYTCPDEIEQEYRKKFDQSYNYTHNYTNIQHCPGMFPALPVSLNCGRDQEVKVSSKNDKSTKNQLEKKNPSSTRQSTESNDSDTIANSKYYTPKHLTTMTPIYNLTQVQRELDFCGSIANNLNLKMSNNRPNFFPVGNNLIYHPQTPVNNFKSFSFCVNNSIKSPTTIKTNKCSGFSNENPITFKREENIDSKIILDNIIIGKDRRTTLMLRNIPNKYTLSNIVDEISTNCWGKYDFINLPIDYERKLNLGYAFINFVDPLHIVLFYETYHNKKWAKYKSDKKINLNYADKQGKKDITCKDDNTYFACEDKRFNFKTLVPKIELPLKYLNFFKKIYPNSVCVEDKTGIYEVKVFCVKSIGKRQSFL